MKKRFLRTSLKFKFISSTLAVALLALSMGGLLLYYNAVTHLHADNEQLIVNKLRLFAQDLEEQYKVLEDISFRVSTHAFYKKSFFERSSYNEIELLSEFAKFKNNSPIITDYFLIYKDSNWVLKSTESKTMFDTFKRYSNISDPDRTLYDTLNNVSSFTIIPTGRTDNEYIFAFPVYTAGRMDESGYATIGFFVSPQSLKNRLSTLSGRFDGNVYACFDNTYIIGINTDSVPYAQMTELLLGMTDGMLEMDDRSALYVCSSDNGSFKVALRTPPDYKFDNLKSFSYISAAYVLTATFILLIAALWVGNYNYQPIGRLLGSLTRKYVKRSETATGKNELESVEKLFDSLLSEKESAQLKLQQQYVIIKKQILKLVINGDPQYHELVSRSFMGIYLPGPVYYLVVVNTECDMNEDTENELTLLVEKLSDSDVSLNFVCSIRENYSTAVISAQDEQQGLDAADCVITLFEERLSGCVCAVERSEGLEGLNSALICAINSIENSGDVNETESTQDKLILPDADITDRIVEAAYLSNWHDANFLFKRLYRKTKDSTKPFIVKRIVYNNLLYKLIAFDTTGAIPKELIELATHAGTLEELAARLGELLRYVCENADIIKEGLESEIDTEGADRNANEILDYINANYWDTCLCLDILSEKFGVSTRHISRIIKRETGVPYKEYLTTLRIRKASEFLLLDDITVTQASKKVGYEDLSNFIKTFKRITGFTPNTYSKKVEESAALQNNGGLRQNLENY